MFRLGRLKKKQVIVVGCETDVGVGTLDDTELTVVEPAIHGEASDRGSGGRQ